MKILYLITSADLGGAQKYVLDLAQHFGGIVAAGVEESELFQLAEQKGIEAYKLYHLRRPINPLKDFLAIWEIYSLIRRIRPDIIHLNSSKAGFLGSIAGKLGGSKIVYTAHGFAFQEPAVELKKQILIAAEKSVSIWRDFTIAVSTNDYNSAVKYKLARRDKLQMIHNGIGQINFDGRKTAREKLNLPEDKIVVGAIANLYRAKGIDILIQATNLLDNPEAIFVAIGDGPEKNNLVGKIAELGLQNRFLLPGRINDAALYLKAFDIFVLPSRKEGFPFVLLEAMQAGLPIVAADVGGVAEATGDAALLVLPKANLIADSIRKLLIDKKTAEELAARALERSKLFGLDEVLEQTAAVYQKLL